MKIIVETTVFLNGGDAAIQVATKRILRTAFGDDTEIVFADMDAQVAGRYYPNNDFIVFPSEQIRKSVFVRLLNRLTKGRVQASLIYWTLIAIIFLERRLRWLKYPGNRGAVAKAIREYIAADLIVSTGGTYLSKKHPGSVALRLPEYERDIYLGKPPIFFTQSMGPFGDDRISRRLASVLRKSPLILVRDQKSMAFAKELTGFTGNIEKVADSVFVLTDQDEIERRRVASRVARPGRPPRIAVSVRPWADFGERDSEVGRAKYHQSVAQAAAWFVEEVGAEVTFVSTCQGVPEYRFNDSDTARNVLKYLPDNVRNSVVIDSQFRDTEALLRKIDEFDGAICTRMHMCILCLCRGVPVLPICYERKTTDLFQSLDLQEYITFIDSIEPDSFRALARRWWQNQESIAEKSWRGTLELRDSALSTVGILKNRFAPAELQPETVS
ncbi:MAG: polysaccharide pyruvyl transferase [Mesorhizobium sp.]|uniref:polysaccharide pyruvyl transferase family protein n=1 Tax=unclassified Mesorhizobium TaxID=325217 RepID=UPI000FCBABD7|nr:MULTISPECIES: polysaccharide pyruvyl transferase family protein [unclassified Mesorhizobium]RUV70445.1 polysaccharide pyruvyl transferase [Mesorhizobium sp. M5C.F.Cr.IN.023.01.1.1]RWF87885.1 MAG: polysaccharide pyruvyl transferase [Mesorhizobium sp.]RWF96852.1 MAG: polysaccharide pyruvyl transferase [Mesorhizobium sp.]RWI41782.1 MAG: polysaccharide pyruvyl transferase [Mesorhizobium sp.]RWI50943.1 MAG: polysaccharide pyruvyl transferase [Mesorhizobium sp.]